MTKKRRMLAATTAALVVMVLTATREKTRMTEHAHRVREHWRRHRPHAYRHLENPDAFFAAAGQEIDTRIATLTPQLAGPDLPGEDYLAKTARWNNARARATEIAIADSGLMQTVGLTRDEWDWDTQEHAEGLIAWAYRMAEQTEGWIDHGLSLEETAARYLLPETFLREMVSSPSPRRFLETHHTQWQASVDARWARDSPSTP